jgi:hypothetical protein
VERVWVWAVGEGLRGGEKLRGGEGIFGDVSDGAGPEEIAVEGDGDVSFEV